MRRVPIVTADDVVEKRAALHPLEVRRIKKRADELVAERWPALVAKLDAANDKRARRRERNLRNLR